MGILFGDLTSLFLGTALIIVGVREARAAHRLAAFDRSAPHTLAFNQLALGLIIVLYAAIQIWSAATSSGLSAANQPVGDPKVDAILGDVGDLTRRISIAFYILVAVGGGLATILMSLYYARRRPVIDRFIASNEPWVVQVLRTAA